MASYFVKFITQIIQHTNKHSPNEFQLFIKISRSYDFFINLHMTSRYQILHLCFPQKIHPIVFDNIDHVFVKL